MGGRYLLGVSAERRAAAGISAGDVLEVEVVLDAAPREVEIPDELATALAQDSAAAAAWDALSPSRKQWHALQVAGAKTAETKARRVSKSVAMLREGRTR